MNKKFFVFSLFLAVAVGLVSCGSEKKVEVKVVEETVVEDTIPYRVLENYTLKKGVKEILTPMITTTKTFENYFKAEKNATKIDFSQDFVIAVALPSTDLSTIVAPYELAYKDTDRLLFTYTVERGTEKVASYRPLLLIAVPYSFKAYVEVKEIK